MSIVDAFQALPQNSQVEIISNIRQSINQEIQEYEEGIRRTNRQYADRIDELKIAGRETEIPSIKNLHQQTVDGIRHELNESIEFRNKFATGSVNYLKEVGKEGLLTTHGLKYLSGESTNSSSNREKLTSQEIEQYHAIKNQIDQMTPAQRKQFQAVEERIGKLQSKIANVEKISEDIRNHPNEGRSTADTGRGPQTEKPGAQHAAPKEQTFDSATQLPHNDKSLHQNLSNIKGQPAPIKTNDQIKNYIQKNRWKGAGIGLGVGVVKSIFDEEEDDVITATGKAVKTGAAVLGTSYLAEIGLDYASSKDYQVANMWAPTTVQDYVKGQVAGSAQKIEELADAERKMITIGGKIGTIAKVGAAIVGVASIVDIGQKVADSREAKRMKHEQEKALVEKEKQRKKKNKEQSYGYIQDGEILFDLFGGRTGHHKMGNAKFM